MISLFKNWINSFDDVASDNDNFFFRSLFGGVLLVGTTMASSVVVANWSAPAGVLNSAHRPDSGFPYAPETWKIIFWSMIGIWSIPVVLLGLWVVFWFLTGKNLFSKFKWW